MGRCMDCKYMSDRRWEDGSDDPDNYMSHSTYKRKYYCEKYGEFHFRGEYHNCFESEDDENSDTEINQGCYVTTACVTFQGLSDDCNELQVLRQLRDRYVINLQNGTTEIEEYYSLAPKIITAINKLNNRSEIYDQIYKLMILKCVNLIENKNDKEAYELYKQSTIKLYERYVGTYTSKI